MSMQTGHYVKSTYIHETFTGLQSLACSVGVDLCRVYGEAGWSETFQSQHTNINALQVLSRDAGNSWSCHQCGYGPYFKLCIHTGGVWTQRKPTGSVQHTIASRRYCMEP
jgi:hypothetical protein